MPRILKFALPLLFTWFTASAQRPAPHAFVEALWNTPVPSGEQRYFDGMLYLMSLLHTSGNFRIFDTP